MARVHLCSVEAQPEIHLNTPVRNPNGAWRQVCHAQPAAPGRGDGEVEVVGADQDDRRRRLMVAVRRLAVLQSPQQVPRLVACGRHDAG